MRSFALRPGNSLTVPRTASSLDSSDSISLFTTNQATGPLTLTPVGFVPTEHASLRWTYNISANKCFRPERRQLFYDRV
jgi:hypothetical protein